VATMIGCLPTQALAFLAVFVYATHATQEIAFEWKPGLILSTISRLLCEVKSTTDFLPVTNWLQQITR